MHGLERGLSEIRRSALAPVVTGVVVATFTLLQVGCAARRGGAPDAGLAAGDHSLSLRHGGRDRSYIVHVPPSLAGQPAPVLIAYHGGGGNAAGFRDYAGLDAQADMHGFLVVYPDGIGALGLHTWNAGTCCGRAQSDGVDDVGFTVAVIEDLATRTAIDRRRVYATGHSNGAMMAYRLAAERADLVAAIVPVAGAMTLDAPFAPSRPVPVLHIHSVDDPRALYGGGLGPPFPLTTQRVAHRPVMEALEAWIARDDCPTEPVTGPTRTGQPGTESADHTATLLEWEPCAEGAVVAHWRLTGAGHGWPGAELPRLRERIVGPATTVISAAQEIWEFVSRFSLP